MVNNVDQKETKTYKQLEQDFIQDALALLDQATTEVADRNSTIEERDQFIYGDGIDRTLTIPAGHDRTPVNWLKRVVEIHKDQFMGRGFQVVSTYNTKDISATTDEQERQSIVLENKKFKEYAEQRQNIYKSIIEDNGGFSLWQELAENASAVGTSVIKAYYDEEEKKYEICPIESVENIYVIWEKDDFREHKALSFVYQTTKAEAIKEYGIDADAPTSLLGQPLEYKWNTSMMTVSDQEMVTVISITGEFDGWAVKNGKLVEVPVGEETELHALIVANKLYMLIGDAKKMPKYYILPNKRARRRAWGISDITDAAIELNRTYIETLSDWRTVASKVNFNKFKGYGFVAGSQIPAPKSRTTEIIPLADGQDIQLLNQGDANQIDFRAQLEEIKEQFVRETRISRVFFDDPSITLNSNQALMTSMKATTDVAEAKKSLWGPIIKEIFEDALETIAMYDDSVKEILDADDSSSIKIMWPSTMQKEDPVYQQMLLNRFNANTISMQSYLEAQGESKEEIDRIREEFENPLTGAILSKSMGNLFGAKLQAGMPQTFVDNGQAPQQQQQGAMQQDMRSQIATPNMNVPGAGVMSQPGSGATPTSAGGALAQNAQQNLGA
jgi:hypothetical protein